MKDTITRRDFLNGVAVGTGAALLGSRQASAQTQSQVQSFTNPATYPPTRTGIRGNHPGSFEVSHAMAWQGKKPAKHQNLDEHYDLVVVGAGISGLAAAKFYRDKMGDEAKILLLDNHDDFGGHAKRNEFHQDGRMLLGVGGSVNLENPGDYSEVAKGLLDDLGIDLDAMKSNIDEFGITGSNTGNVLAFPGELGHVSVAGKWSEFMFGIGDYESAVKALPVPATEQVKLIEFFSGKVDYLKDLPLSEQRTYVETTSYIDFLTKRVGLADATANIFYPVAKLIYGPAGSRISVMEAFYLGSPGVQGISWLSELAEQIVAGVTVPDHSSLYFPDGNASVARLLVHKLIPNVAPGTQGFNDIAASRFDYNALDQAGEAVRLRLNSTVVGVQETMNNRVVVDYVQEGSPLSVTGDHCVLACYNGAIPYLCPKLPEQQKEALNYGPKVPLVFSNVLLKNGHAWSKLGVSNVTCPDDPYVVITVAPPTTTGGHQPPRSADDPMVVYLLGIPNVAVTGSETSRELCRTARHQVYATTFETYEREIRDQLQGVLGKHGFNHETDITAITVNRWPHGYAYEYMALDDPKWEAGQAPHEIGRAQFGRISIANSDSEAYAYLDAAVDAAWRAVEEQANSN
ncbi:MAG: NAD(P)/FAD-dependent oxidoreductase [Gammaproteobacteria bacterium]|nr:NAD(P)/FAD-dependent oxidoreductase [Gammaproteobacteria bacterium]